MMIIKIWKAFLLIYSWNVIYSYNLDFTITHGVYLNAERSQYFETIQLELCMKECEKRMNCSSINFDRTLLQCNLSIYNHIDGVSELNHNPDRIYAVLNSRSVECADCLEYESCLFLSSGTRVCIPTECSSTRPEVINIVEDSFDPPFIRYAVTDVCASTTTVMSSTCIPGKSWSYDNSICVTPQSILKDGIVTMSSIHQSDGVLDKYCMDSGKSWSSLHNTVNEWIQLELPSIYNITAVLSKGRFNHDQWVKSYHLSYMDESTSTWSQFSNVYDGNSDRDTLVTHEFDGGILTRGIRLQPKTWHGHISLRFDVLGCSSA